MLVLVTGATGRFVQAFIARLAREGEAPRIRALCHCSVLPESEGLSVAGGSTADRGVRKAAGQDLPAVPARAPSVSNRLDDSRARAELGRRPRYDLRRLIDPARSYVRTAEEPISALYPG